MSFPAYPTYKDSGVEWLAEVPTHWSVHRISELYREVAEPGHDELPILSVSIHDGVSDDEAEPDDEGRKINRSDDRSKYKQVRPNDLVYNMMRAWQGGFGSVKVLGMVSPAYVVARPRYDVPSGLVELMLRTDAAIEEMRRRSKGVTDFRLRLYWDEFKDMRIALPPAREQLDVLHFLGRETAKIDAMVEEQQRLIALLKEKRQVVISNAVTRGLNAAVPMKDSGVEWFGDVPAHWVFYNLKHITIPKNGIQMGPFGGMLTDVSEEDIGYKVYGQENTISGDFERGSRWIDLDRFRELSVYSLAPGDIILTRKGSIGNCRIIPEGIKPGIADSDTIRLRLNVQLVLNRYIDVLFRDSAFVKAQLQMSKRGAILSGLNTNVVANLLIPTPPVSEQSEILDNVVAVTEKTEALVLEAEKAISLLNERRSALISSAVTGKIDVRGSAKVLPFAVDRARARRLIASEIIDRSAHQATFGRTKLQKLLYLVEAHANVNELAGRYVRMPYGPLDQDMIDEIEGAAADMGFAVDDPGSRKMVRYRPVAARGRNRGELAEWLGDDRYAKLDKLITDFADLDTRAAEAVATLYAVWNDALIDGEAPSDDWIINGFLTAWNKSKAENFGRHELPHRLGWMRRHGLVPTGAGPKTSIGGLFA